MPARPDQAPIARIRSCGRNDDCRIARLPGVSRAPPIPWTARAATSVSMFGAMPQASDATANHTTPMTKTRRRPNRSPSEPPSRINEASVSV